MSGNIERIDCLVEVDHTALLSAVSTHLLISATQAALEPHHIELDTINDFPALNMVPVKVDDVEQRYKIYLVLVGSYGDLGYVILAQSTFNVKQESYDSDYIMYRFYHEQPQVVVRVQSDERYDPQSNRDLDKALSGIFQDLYTSP
jgi:hypothetical protein